jgi:KDO2-lipid IV(A) lauroyltransferase
MASQNKKQHKPFKSRMILGLVKLLASLPISLARALLRPVGWLQLMLPNRTKTVTENNLYYCDVDLGTMTARQVRNQSILHSTDLIAESSWIWAHDYAANRKLIRNLTISEAFTNTAGGKLIISPHLGNWELVYAYLSNEHQSAGLYKPPTIDALEDFMSKGREGELFRTDTTGVRKILKWLKADGSLFLLPDQQPPEGSGVFADFFGRPAYTMTMLHGLVKRTGASLWMAHALKMPQGYEIELYPLDIAADLSAEEFNTILNGYMEKAILKAPEQYQWGYKRFKKTPDGSPSIYDKQS